MNHRALLIAATVGLSIAATHPVAAGDPGPRPDPVYRYNDLAPLGAGPGEAAAYADEGLATRSRSERIARTGTRVETTARFAPAHSSGIGYVHYVPGRSYGPPRYRYGYYPAPRLRYGYYPAKRVFRGPCIERVVRYTPRGKVVRVVIRCQRYY